MENAGVISRIHCRKRPSGPFSETRQRANALKSDVRSRVEHVSAVQNEKKDLADRAVAFARAKAKIAAAKKL